MKQKLCPHCQTPSPADTRFCRVCGASLRYVGEDDSLASPLDKTVPFTRNLPETTELPTIQIDDAVSPHADTASTTALVSDRQAPDAAADSHLFAGGETTLISEYDAPRGTAPTLASTTALPRAHATSPVNFNELPAAPETAALVEQDTQFTRDVLRRPPGKLLESQPTANNRTHSAPLTARKPALEQKQKGWLWWSLASTCVAAVAAVSMLVALNLYSRRAPVDTDDASAAQASALNPQAESLRLTEEAETLIAAQDFDAGVARLRQAVQLDERNARAQLQLGAALEQGGKRNEAIFFYEAAAALTPNDSLAWRQLANAQLAENRFADAVQSYRRLFALAANNAANGAAPGTAPAVLPNDETLRLRYAGALRGAGEIEQARKLFTQLAASRSPAIKSAAQAQLALINDSGNTSAPATATNQNSVSSADAEQREAFAQIPPPESAPIVTPPRDAALNAKADAAVSTKPTNTRAATATPNTAERRLTAQERYERGVNLYSSNRASALADFSAVADAIPDAHYYLGLARTQGRTPRAMHRAELLAALTHFQIAAQRGTRHTAQAARYAEQLGREYDRRRKQ